MGAGNPLHAVQRVFAASTRAHPVPEPPEVTLWNADFELGTIRPDRPEAGVRPESEPLAPRANLEAIASILAVGVLRRRARKGGFPGDIGSKAKNLQL